jgi:drug/metabolite transporter (DMT)-like permease
MLPPVRRPRVAYAALAFASLLFGSTFVVVKEALETLPPYAFVGWRFLLGAAALLLVARPQTQAAWRDGAIAGVLLFAGYALQTQGLTSTTASNSGLITGLYVVFTPLIAAAFGRFLPRGWVVAGALLAFGGLAALALQDGLQLQSGDAATVGCAVAFAAHIVFLARIAHRHPVVGLTAVQLAMTAALGLGLSALTEGFPLPDASVWPAVIGTGLLVSGGAFLLQVWSQTVIGPARTAIILSLEPVFAAATAALVLGERLTVRGWLGAGLILAGIYVVLAATGEEDELPAAEAITAAH